MRDAVDDDRVEPFRGAVDGGCEPGRAGADDDEVAGCLARRRDGQPDSPGELGVARIAQHLLAAPDHHRRLRRRDAQLAQERVRGRVVLEVDPAVREPVARRELAQPARVGRVARAEDPESGAKSDQDRAADDERAQDQIAEHRILRPRSRAAGRRARRGPRRLARDRGHEHGLARQQVELAEEPPRAVCGNQALGAVPALDDRDQSLQDDDEVVALVPRLEDHVARARVAALPLRFQRPSSAAG